MIPPSDPMAAATMATTAHAPMIHAFCWLSAMSCISSLSTRNMVALCARNRCSRSLPRLRHAPGFGHAFFAPSMLSVSSFSNILRKSLAMDVSNRSTRSSSFSIRSSDVMGGFYGVWGELLFSLWRPWVVSYQSGSPFGRPVLVWSASNTMRFPCPHRRLDPPV